MNKKAIIRRTGYAICVLLVVAALVVVATRLLFVPAPREEGYRLVGRWGGTGTEPGRFDEPIGVAVADDEVFVSDARNGRIQVFDRAGALRRIIGRGVGLERTMHLAVAGDRVYVADFLADRVVVLGRDGGRRDAIGRTGAGPGALDGPGGIAVGPKGDLYLADFYNHRVQRLDADGRFIRQWGETGVKGTASGRFNYPTGVAVAADGTVFVADGYNDRVQTFAPDGAPLNKWGGPFAANIHGPFNGWFATVTDVATGPDGTVFVTDFYNDRVQKFTAEGDFLTAFGEDELDRPTSVAVAPDGTVYVVSHRGDEVQIWRRDRGSGH